MLFPVLVLFLSSSVIQMYLWLVQFRAIAAIPKSSLTDMEQLPRLTLILAVKDDLNFIRANLGFLADQVYPEYDILIVNDHSKDQLLSYLENLKIPNLKVLDLPWNKSGKKHAISYAIQQTKTPWIVTTDADCRPESKFWLSELMAHHDNKDLILGYSPYSCSENSFLAKLIHYESWYIAMQYLSAAFIGRPYMGVGRNMAFRRSVYENIGGYTNHLDLVSGDDDLFVSSLSGNARIGINFSKNAWVWSFPKQTIRDYLNQKRRHLTTAPRYRTSTKLWLSVIYLSQITWYVTWLMLSLIEPWILSIILLRMVILLIVSYRPQKEKYLYSKYGLSIVFDVILCVIYTLLSFTYIFPKKNW